MEIFCDFFEFESMFTPGVITYNCRVTKVNRIASNGRVFIVHTAHLEGKSHRDVESITFSHLHMEHFPQLLCYYFPNLKSVSVVACGLKKISRHDFCGYGNLEELMLNGNKITELPQSNLFEHAPNLKTISFFRNQIDFVDENAFSGLKNLTKVDFRFNSTNVDCVFSQNENDQRLLSDKINSFMGFTFWDVRAKPSGNLEMLKVFELLRNFDEITQLYYVEFYNFRLSMTYQRCQNLMNEELLPENI